MESYRIISRYNGKEFCFDIYSHKVDCVHSKWNDDGTSNKYYEFKSVLINEEVEEEYEEDGELKTRTITREVPYKAYYKDTDEKNGVIIFIEVRKHNRAKYFEAVKSQLMYLKDDIRFMEEDYSGRNNEVKFKANILYEDDNIIMSDYNYYQRPHFVIKNVGYGIIDFNELDLSHKFGNIGIKVKMEDINVTPSRETVIYSTKTRDAVLKQYEKVAATVESKIQGALGQDNFVDWVTSCNKIMFSSSNSNDTISRLSGLIDKSTLKPKYKDTNIAFNSELKQLITPLFAVTHNQLINNYDYRKSKQTKKIEKTESNSSIIFDKQLYFQFTQGNSRVTTYLAGSTTGGFASIRLAAGYKFLDEVFHEYVTNKIGKEEFLLKCDALFIEQEKDTKKLENIRVMFIKTAIILDYLVSSKSVEVYSEKLVPETFKMTESDDEIEADFEEILEINRKEAYQATLKQRRENKAFIGSIMAHKRKSSYQYASGFDRKEVSASEFEATELYYGTDDDAITYDFLMHIEGASPIAKMNESRYFYWNDDIKIIKVAKSNLRHVKNRAKPLQHYLIRVDNNGVFSSCEAMKNIFTAAAIHGILGDRCEFMTNFREFSSEITDIYDELTQFINRQPSLDTIESRSDSIVETLLAAYKVQLELIQHPSIIEEDRQDLIDQMIPSTLDLDIIDIDLIDIEKYNEALKLSAFADVYGSILSYIEPLQDSNMPILNASLVMELRSIISSRTDQLEYEYENINK